MTTKKEQEVELLYPAPYEYVSEIVKPFRDDIWRLEGEIEKLDYLSVRPDRPVLRFEPGGMRSTKAENYVDRVKLENKKEEYLLQLRQRVELEIKNEDPEEQKSVREAVRDDIGRNPLLTKTKEELKYLQKERRDLSLSQNYAAMLLKYSKEAKINVEKRDPEPEAKQPVASERFGKTLTFMHHMENKRDVTERRLVIEPDKD